MCWLYSEQFAGLRDAPEPTGKSVQGEGGDESSFILENPGMLFLLVIMGAELGVRRKGGGFAFQAVVYSPMVAGRQD